MGDGVGEAVEDVGELFSSGISAVTLLVEVSSNATSGVGVRSDGSATGE